MLSELNVNGKRKRFTKKRKSMYFKSLAIAREKTGKWSKIIKLKHAPKGLSCVPTREDINYALKGLDYFEYGIKPRVEELGLEHYVRLSKRLKFDIVNTIRHSFGIKMSKSYNYCKELGFDLPLEYEFFNADRLKSEYISSGGNHDNDCSVRAFSKMLDISYDESRIRLQNVSGENASSDGTDSDVLKKYCFKYGLSFQSDITLFNGKRFGNLSPYELYDMIPLLKHETLAIGVYRHMFCIKKGVIYDHSNYGHYAIDFIICRRDREETLKRLLKSNLRSSCNIRIIANERWQRATPWRTLAFDLRIDREVMRLTPNNPEYRLELRKLISGWRSQEEFIDWISSYKNIVKKLSRRLDMKEDDVRDMIRICQANKGIDKLILPECDKAF